MMEAATQRAWRAAPRLLVAVLLLVPVERAPGAVQALVLLTLVAAGQLIGWSLAERLLAGLAAAERAFAAAALGLAVCLVVGIGLGHCGLLTGGCFRGVLAALVASTVFLTPRAQAGAPRGTRPRGARAGDAVGSPDSEEPLSRPPVLSAAGERRSWALRRALRLGAPLRWRRLQRAVLWAAMLLVVAVFLRTAVRHRHAPPGHFSFDDTSYHLTTVATWQLHHDLRMPRFTFGDPRTPFYPFSSELLAWELTTPFAGGDIAARWMELPFALLTLVGLVVVARRLGAGESALLAPLLYATVSESFPDMALTAGNDHALAFASVVSVHGALLLRDRPRPTVGVYAGIGLGLLLATKYLAVMYAPLLVVAVVLAVVAPRRGGEPLRRRAGAWLAVALAALVVGGYAYLRNAVTTGNPIFPVSLTVAGWSLPGWQDVAPAVWGKADDAAFDPWRFPWVRADRFGQLFRGTLLPAAMLAPFAALVLVPRRRRALYAWLFAVPLCVYLLFVRLVEDHRGVRYLLPGLAIAAVAAAWLVSRLPPRPRLVVALALAPLAAARWVADLPEILLLLPVALGAGWALGLRRARRRAVSPAAAGAVALGCALLLAALAPATMRRYEQHRYDDERAAGAFERLVGAGPARVAYAGWNQPYLFCGRRLQHALFMPPATPGTETMYYSWRGPVDQGLAMRPRRAWERNLDHLRVDWVVWVLAGAGIRPERDFMLRSPQRFTCVYTDGQVEVWRLRR